MKNAGRKEWASNVSSGASGCVLLSLFPVLRLPGIPATTPATLQTFALSKRKLLAKGHVLQEDIHLCSLRRSIATMLSI